MSENPTTGVARHVTDPSTPAPGFVRLTDELFAVLDLEGRLLAVTPWWAQLLQRSEDEMVGRSVLEFLPAEDRELAARAIELAATRGQTRGGDLRMVDAGGSLRPIRVHLFRSPLWNEIYAVGQDLEKLAEVERALEFRLAIERVVSHIASRLITIPAEALPGAIREGLGELGRVLGADRAYLVAHDEEGSGVEIAQEWSAAGVAADGDRIHHDIVLPIVVEGSERGAVGFAMGSAPAQMKEEIVGLLQLVGEVWINRIQRARAERALSEAKAELERRNADLERSNQELQDFAYVASHDLKSPLLVVRGFLDLLVRQKRDVLDEDARTYIDAAARGAERMERLIEDLLAYSRAGRRDAPAGPVDLKALLGAVVADSYAEIEAAGATVKVGEMPTVEGDETLLRQVFQNLLGNAIKFGRPGVAPEVTFDALPSGDEWVVRVTDNGIGIAASDRQRIFTMFARLEAGGDRPGSGIGLAICARAVSAHRGRIWVEDRPGSEPGSRFCVTLPAAPERSRTR